MTLLEALKTKCKRFDVWIDNYMFEIYLHKNGKNLVLKCGEDMPATKNFMLANWIPVTDEGLVMCDPPLTVNNS